MADQNSKRRRRKSIGVIVQKISFIRTFPCFLSYFIAKDEREREKEKSEKD